MKEKCRGHTPFQCWFLNMIMSLNVTWKNISVCAKNVGFEVLMAVTVRSTALRLLLLVSYLLSLRTWRLRWYVPPKRRAVSGVRSITTDKIVIFMCLVVGRSHSRMFIFCMKKFLWNITYYLYTQTGVCWNIIDFCMYKWFCVKRRMWLLYIRNILCVTLNNVFMYTK
jgi:hypothetical protein